MAERHRFANLEVPDRPAMEVVHVGTADTAEGHGDPNFIRCQRAVRYLLDPQILLAVTNRSEHEMHLWWVCARYHGAMDPLFSLAGKRALVTGGARGIGFAIAEALSTAGASVILNGRTPPA